MTNDRKHLTTESNKKKTTRRVRTIHEKTFDKLPVETTNDKRKNHDDISAQRNEINEKRQKEYDDASEKIIENNFWKRQTTNEEILRKSSASEND